MIPNPRIDRGRGSKRFTINWRVIGDIRNGVIGTPALQKMTRHRPCWPVPNRFDIFGPSSENLKKINPFKVPFIVYTFRLQPWKSLHC